MGGLLQGMPYLNLAMGIRKGFLEEGKSKKRSPARRKEVRVGISNTNKGNSICRRVCGTLGAPKQYRLARSQSEEVKKHR